MIAACQYYLSEHTTLLQPQRSTLQVTTNAGGVVA